MPADSLSSYSKARFFSTSLFCSGPSLLDSGLPGFEKARGAAERDGSVTGQPCPGRWERNDPSHGHQIRLAVGRNMQGLERVVSDLAVARDLCHHRRQRCDPCLHTPSKPLPPETRAVSQWNPLLRFDITGCNRSALKQSKTDYYDRSRRAARRCDHHPIGRGPPRYEQ